MDSAVSDAITVILGLVFCSIFGVACCDKPHITAEEHDEQLWTVKDVIKDRDVPDRDENKD